MMDGEWDCDITTSKRKLKYLIRALAHETGVYYCICVPCMDWKLHMVRIRQQPTCNHGSFRAVGKLSTFLNKNARTWRRIVNYVCDAITSTSLFEKLTEYDRWMRCPFTKAWFGEEGRNEWRDGYIWGFRVRKRSGSAVLCCMTGNVHFVLPLYME